MNVTPSTPVYLIDPESRTVTWRGTLSAFRDANVEAWPTWGDFRGVMEDLSRNGQSVFGGGAAPAMLLTTAAHANGLHVSEIAWQGVQLVSGHSWCRWGSDHSTGLWAWGSMLARNERSGSCTGPSPWAARHRSWPSSRATSDPASC